MSQVLWGQDRPRVSGALSRMCPSEAKPQGSEGAASLEVDSVLGGTIEHRRQVGTGRSDRGKLRGRTCTRPWLDNQAQITLVLEDLALNQLGRGMTRRRIRDRISQRRGELHHERYVVIAHPSEFSRIDGQHGIAETVKQPVTVVIEKCAGPGTE